jgi:hypothetical protein
MPSQQEIQAAARAICELDGVQCQCICAPETRGSVKHCEGPFAQAKAALEAAERVRWQAIETAPKDGDLILCASSPEEVRMSTGRWAEGYWLWGHEEEPTHWQPLPSPPESK